MEEKILVLDFGGQYNQLIARRVREQHVYAEIKPYNKITPEAIVAEGYQGIIFTGGPNSVYDEKSPHYDPRILELGIPILGICYGAQLMAYMAGGRVDSAENSSEYGKTVVNTRPNAFWRDVPGRQIRKALRSRQRVPRKPPAIMWKRRRRRWRTFTFAIKRRCMRMTTKTVL